MPHKKRLTNKNISIPVQLIERRIYLIRGHKVLLDFDLADLYGVPTKRLNQQVTRNKKRFPEDFMFQLNQKEAEALRSQIVTSKIGRGGRRYLPYAFTEQGVAMLSSVLNSDQAIKVNIAIMRAFVRLRQMLETNADLNLRFGTSSLERCQYNALQFGKTVSTERGGIGLGLLLTGSTSRSPDATAFGTDLLHPLVRNLSLNFHRHRLQILFSRRAHHTLYLSRNLLSLISVSLYDDLIMNDVDDLRVRVAQFITHQAKRALQDVGARSLDRCVLAVALRH